MTDPARYRLPVRVYLEDTDAQGIVYHASYLRFFERARSEILDTMGITFEEMARGSRRYVVYEMRIRFRRIAKVGDRLEILTTMQRGSEYRLTFRQEARHAGGKLPLVNAEVDVVCIDESGKLVELPPLPGISEE